MLWIKTNSRGRVKIDKLKKLKLKKFIGKLKDKLRRSFRAICAKTDVNDLLREAYILKSLGYQFIRTYEQDGVHPR